MFSYVCFARLQASMTWDVLDMSRDFWIAEVKGLLQVRADLLITALCKHSYSNTFCSHCTPFGQRWKLSFNCCSAELIAQSVLIHWCNYKEGNGSHLLDFSEDIEQSTALWYEWYEGLSLLLASLAWKAEVTLGVWKWAEGSQVS